MSPRSCTPIPPRTRRSARPTWPCRASRCTPIHESPSPKPCPDRSTSPPRRHMATEVTLPALGESVTEGTVTRWLKQVGDSVSVDEALLEVSTDKVDTEIPSPVAGTLLEIKASEDETVEVGAVLAGIGDQGEPTGDGAAAGEASGADEQGDAEAESQAEGGSEPAQAETEPQEQEPERPEQPAVAEQPEPSPS